MKSTKLTERLILRELIESEDYITPYSLWKKYRITPNELVKSINRLIGSDIIVIKDSKIMFSNNGRQWIIKNRKKLLAYENKQWRECPEKFQQPKLPINKPYVPLISLLDDELKIK